jgi:hypothetical protein
MEQPRRNASRNTSTSLSLAAGGVCLGIALAHAYAAASGPPPPMPAIRWAPEPVMAGWQPVDGEAPDDEPINAASVPPLETWDGLYVGSIMTRDGGRVTYGVTVRAGIGTGTQSRLDCGTAPLSLRISPVGDVSGMATVFGLTCLKTEVALRGRALTGHLQLRVGTQYLELARP